MLKTLIKKQILEIWESSLIDKRTGKARSKKGIALIAALFIVLFLGLGAAFYEMADGLCGIIIGHGINWLYFALMGLLSMVLGVFGSVFNTYASVYLPKDNEFMLSLPIPYRTLLLARLAAVYATSLLYCSLVWIPVMIAYWVTAPVNVLNVIFPILMTFIIALFVSVLSCVLGWVVALIASKAKGKSYITVIISLAVVALYYFLYFKLIGSLDNIINRIAEIGDKVRSWLHYSYLLGSASDGDVFSMLIITGITLVLAGICFLVLSKTFIKLSAVAAGGGKKSKAHADYTKRTVKTALLRREYKHFTSVSVWMLNGGFGLVLLLAAAAALIIKSGSIRSLLPTLSAKIPELYALLPVLLTSAVCLILSTNVILSASVSIEGKTLWQIQTLPVEPWEILRAKERMSVQLSTVPSLFFVLVCGTVLRLHLWETVLICIAVAIYAWAFSDFGLFVNLKMPNFSWTNAASLTKQSLPVVICLFSGWLFCIGVVAGGYFFAKVAAIWVVLCAYILLFLILLTVLHTWLKKKGTKVFASL